MSSENDMSTSVYRPHFRGLFAPVYRITWSMRKIFLSRLVNVLFIHEGDWSERDSALGIVPNSPISSPYLEYGVRWPKRVEMAYELKAGHRKS